MGTCYDTMNFDNYRLIFVLLAFNTPREGVAGYVWE